MTELPWLPEDVAVYLLHKQERMPEAHRGGVQAPSLLYLTLYFSLARGILLGWEIDFKSLFTAKKLLPNPTFPRVVAFFSPLKPVSHSHIPRPCAGTFALTHMCIQTHTNSHVAQIRFCLYFYFFVF